MASGMRFFLRDVGIWVCVMLDLKNSNVVCRPGYFIAELLAYTLHTAVQIWFIPNNYHYKFCLTIFCSHHLASLPSVFYIVPPNKQNFAPFRAHINEISIILSTISFTETSKSIMYSR